MRDREQYLQRSEHPIFVTSKKQEIKFCPANCNGLNANNNKFFLL